MTGHTSSSVGGLCQYYRTYPCILYAAAGASCATNIPRANSTRNCVSAPVAASDLRAGNHLRFTGCHITGLLIISVLARRAFAVNGLYGTLLDFSDVIGGFQRQDFINWICR